MIGGSTSFDDTEVARQPIEKTDGLVRGGSLLAVCVEPCGARVACGREIQDQAAADLRAVARPPLSLARLALRDEVGELGFGDAAPGDLEPDHERAALPPARTAPAAVAGDERALLAARADERGVGGDA